MLNHVEVIVAIYMGSVSLMAAGQSQPHCSKGFQPYQDRCISQRMADYITCVKESGGNSERITLEVKNANNGSTGVGVKGAGSGVVAKGSGSVTVDHATEQALASRFEQIWTSKGMEECRKVLDPPRVARPKTVPQQKSPSESQQGSQHDSTDPQSKALSVASASPPVTLNNSPGSAVSINQQGGITAGTVNIDTHPHIAITDAQRDSLATTMRSFAGGKAFILVNTPQTAELVAFANKLHDSLVAAGIEAGIANGMSMSEGVESPKPLFVGFKCSTASMARALINGILGTHILAGEQISYHQYGEESQDQLQIILTQPN